jgi:hypothetical protein
MNRRNCVFPHLRRIPYPILQFQQLIELLLLYRRLSSLRSSHELYNALRRSDSLAVQHPPTIATYASEATYLIGISLAFVQK